MGLSFFDKNLQFCASFKFMSFPWQGFNRQSSLLFKILSSVRSHHQASPFLSQLLLRLDFNKYYSQAEGALAP